MPYGVRRKGRKWEVYNTKTGRKKSSHATEKGAAAKKRALDAKKRRKR